MTMRLCLILHNHQPIGNFHNVFEQAYQDSYLPFLNVFERFDSLRCSLHCSGPLMRWLDEHRSEYVDRLAGLVAAGRLEIVGGAYYEPILTMIPGRDRIGQIRSYTSWLTDRLGCTVQGLWVPERVWEQSLASDLATSGIRYTVLDDFHFRNAGLSPHQLEGYYVTEHDGKLLNVLPGSERLRYLIPFAQPHETVDYLRGIAERNPQAVMVFGDDGEKFGTWPDTKKHVYEDGWLQRFFELLSANGDWLSVTTAAEAIREVLPLGKIYLPDCSYREMTEWALPVDQQLEYEAASHEMENDPRWPRLKRFVRGGFWRNFKVKYPESNEMYSRMMMVSSRLEQLEHEGGDGDAIGQAREALYRGQCNCSYWHGAFGGIYLPHLRNAVYHHLIAADNALEKAVGRTGPWIEATAGDFNYDVRQEVRLANDKLICLLAPSAGGQLYELDVRTICHNLLATLARRPESYHQRVVAGPRQAHDNCSSIHDRVVFKQEGLDRRLQYDAHLRRSLIDHFYDQEVSLESVLNGQAMERGDFVAGGYEAKIRRNPQRIQVQMTRAGNVNGWPLRITKGVTSEAGSGSLEIAYLLENLPPDQTLHFAVELNFAGLPAGADDRFFYRPGREGAIAQQLGQLGSRLELEDGTGLGLTDQWLGIDLRLAFNRPTRFWTFPIETVSQSESGFELVHQSVVVQPHWLVRGDAEGRWSVTFRLDVDTALAESRWEQQTATVGS